IPEGIRWNLNSSPSRTIVWPALLPPWKRTIASARSASRSVTLPLPSSPHWAPTITSPGIAGALCRFGRLGDLAVAAIAAKKRHLVADLAQSGDRPAADLVLQLLVGKVGRDQDRALRLIALVDQRVELLEHPVAALLGTEVVDMEQVNRGQPLEESEVGVAAGLGVVGATDASEQLRQRVDRDRAAGLQRRLGDQHRQRRLAGARVAEEPEAAPGVEASVEIIDVGAHFLDRGLGLDVAHAAPLEPLRAALAFARHVLGPENPAGGVANAKRAGLFAKRFVAGNCRHQN